VSADGKHIDDRTRALAQVEAVRVVQVVVPSLIPVPEASRPRAWSNGAPMSLPEAEASPVPPDNGIGKAALEDGKRSRKIRKVPVYYGIRAKESGHNHRHGGRDHCEYVLPWPMK
jgi:hypothetical protein